MNSVDIPARTVPVLDRADVVVVGGGTSGFIAATAAARAGARTLLVERFGYLGGCTTATYNTSIGRFFDSNGDQIIRGLAWEYLERMQRDGQAFLGLNGWNQIWPLWTKKVALDMVTETGVTLYLYTWVSDVLKRDGRIEGLVAQTKGGSGAILGRAFVDASGDADLVAWAGAPFEMAGVDALQQVSCDYTACGVDAARVVEWARANQERVTITGQGHEHQPAGAQPMFTIVVHGEQTHTHAGTQHHVGVMPTVKLCIYREAVRLQGNVEIDPLDPRALTYAETEGLCGVLEHLKVLQQTIPGFEHAFVVAQNHLGVRETRRIVGDHVLTLDDLHNQARFDDVVALNCRSLDYHLKGTVFKLTQLIGHHDIPLRALLPQGVENMIVCGRCIACDHLAQASLRGAATCMATGHAAGVAAAAAASGEGRFRDLDIRSVQRTLIEQGAVLGVGERVALFG